MSTFTTRKESDALIVHFDSPTGLNDFRNTGLRDELYELVQGCDDPRVALDLLKIDFLSSSGVAILIGLKRRIDTRNGKLALFHVQSTVCDVLKMMKLDRYFTMTADEHSAVASLRPISTI